MAALVCITSCGVFVDPADEKITSKPEVLFQEGSYYLNKNNFKAAAEKFETLENEHPTSEYTPEAKVRKAYALFLDGNYILSQLIIDDFIRQYPAHNSTSYMYYLKGLSYYNQIVDIGRDQELTHKALESFEDVIRRYPYSKYAKDAKLKIDYAKNTLAGKEMDIGRFYVRTNKLIAALGRFENVVDNYETSIFIPEALYRLTEIYYALGDIEQAKVYASVLGHNYPDDDWYAKSYDIIVDKEFDPNVSWYKKYLGNIW
ncbi:UNVERIFIED_CONTAM: hypothetical protein GTU68_062815 [Idotea baltica]|nr:hypothetical protein [Idotea baltica]